MLKQVEKEVRRRLHLLGLVRTGCSIVEACERLGLSRRVYYVTLRAHRSGGIEAVRATVHRAWLRRGQDELVLRWTQKHPGWGRVRLAQALAGRGIEVSPTTVRRIWSRHGLLGKHSNWTSGEETQP